MPKYLLSYHGGNPNLTEAEQESSMAAWGAWLGGLGDALVDGGNPIGAVATISSDGTTSHDGGSNPVNGYSLVTAPDIEGALSLAKGCPILSNGGSVEIGETIDVM